MELTPKEIRNIIEYTIDNNRRLQDEGKDPQAIAIWGNPGIGKTQIVEQIARDRKYNFVSIQLSQIMEQSELLGWPIKEHYVCKDDDCTWITAELIDAYVKAGYNITEETRMSYAVPQWIKSIDPSIPTIFLADDFNRAAPHIITSFMQVILKQEYISWKLPKYTTIVLTCNYDDGGENVQSLDVATISRMINFHIKFDISDWQKWAESYGIDGRCINFLSLYHYDLIDGDKDKQKIMNARNYTMFANMISGIHDWSKKESLSLILEIASGCFNDKENILGNLFTIFIGNKLDKLISPEDLVFKDWKYVKTALTDQLYDDDNYRADIASVITNRFINYTEMYFENKLGPSKTIIDRIIDLVDNDKQLLTEDLIFALIRTLNAKYPDKTNKLLINPKIVKHIV